MYLLSQRLPRGTTRPRRWPHVCRIEAYHWSNGGLFRRDNGPSNFKQPGPQCLRSESASSQSALWDLSWPPFSMSEVLSSPYHSGPGNKSQGTLLPPCPSCPRALSEPALQPLSKESFSPGSIGAGSFRHTSEQTNGMFGEGSIGALELPFGQS